VISKIVNNKMKRQKKKRKMNKRTNMLTIQWIWMKKKMTISLNMPIN